MTPSTDTQTAAPSLVLASDPPPVGRFFVAFCALLALALGLAVLSEAGAANNADQAHAEASAEPSQHDASR